MMNGHQLQDPASSSEKAIEAAKEAGLRYVSDNAPGIRRIPAGKGLHYLNADGQRVTDSATLDRIRQLAIPPAWTEVWICARADGHIQATGRDARRRKQYRYHPDWRATRDTTKFERMIAFARALPQIRRRVGRDLRRRGIGREKVLAAMVQLLETTFMRIGNEEYVQQNHSFGLSTLRNRHVDIRGGSLHFHFQGKSGKTHNIDLYDPRLAKIVRATQELPGQELFQYQDENGQPQQISSEDVNAYLREMAGDEFSAKDFRTWAGTVLAALSLREYIVSGDPPTKKNLQAAVAHVAGRLGNTPAICRKCYIHPAVMEGYLRGESVYIQGPLPSGAAPRIRWRLGIEEAAVVSFLERKLGQKKVPLAALLRKSLRSQKRVAIARTRNAAK